MHIRTRHRAVPARQTSSWGGLFVCPNGVRFSPKPPIRPCATQLHSDRTSRAPDPRASREADSNVAPGSPSQGREEHRPTQTCKGVGANSTVNSIRQAPDPIGGAVACQPRRPLRRRSGSQRRGTCLASIAAMLRTLNPESKVRFLGEARKPWWLLVANSDFQSGPHEFDPRPRCQASFV